MFRFFVNKKISDTHFELSPETLKHINIARVTNKQFICTYEGVFHICILDNSSAKIIEVMSTNHELKGEVIIAAAIINTKRFEWMIQKAAELGATSIIPVLSTNVEQKIGNNISKKVERWNEISKNACEQSFRNNIMKVKDPQLFKDVIDLKINNKYIAHEKAKDNVPLELPSNSLFLIGPEGGFTELEINSSIDKGFKVLSLGSRILRAETAPLFILSRIK